MACYVLDTSAVLRLLNAEPGYETVLGLLEAAQAGNDAVVLPFMAVMELEYLTLRRRGVRVAQRVLSLVHEWPVEIRHSSDEWCREAARIKATGSLSVADAWIAGLACLLNAELVHSDPEYDGVPNLRSIRLAS